jgi:8-oxo-dGTP pyrophosphatase MutT (NUDIX family)
MAVKEVSNFPSAFKHYKPRSQKVYGILCVSSKNRILLVRGRLSGIWSLPKGHLKGNELPHECAIRELYEEAGVRFNRIDYDYVQKLYAGEYFIYRVDEELTPCVKDTREISEAGWYSLEELKRFHCNVDIMSMLSKIAAGKLSL